MKDDDTRTQPMCVPLLASLQLKHSKAGGNEQLNN